MKTLRLFLISIVTTFTVIACSTTPEGRSQLILMPAAQMDTMGSQAFNEMKSQTPVDNSPAINTYVRCITDLIIRQLDDDNDPADWEVRVFRSKDINAFALPGRKIGVYTGIMDAAAKTPGQLAAVLGHEVGHVIANHGNERVSTALVSQIGLVAVGEAMRTKADKNHGLLMAAMGLGVQFGVLMPHGRNQESEADIIGLDLMAKAGFDPRESVTLWRNMAAASGGKVPEFLSTHPSNDTRISGLNSRMSSAIKLYESSPYKDEAALCRR